MPWGEFLNVYGLVLPAIFFGAFVARATGVGFALIVVAALLALPHLDQPTALFLSAPLSLLNLSFAAAGLYRDIPWGTVQRLSLPLALGFAAGFGLGIYVPKVWMLAFGLIVVAYTFVTMVRPPQQSLQSAVARMDVGGGLTGLMTGALSFPGPPISAFLLARGFIGNPVRVTIALVGLFGAGLRLILGGGFARPLPEYGQLLLVGAALTVCGTLVGWLVARRMSPTVHRVLIILMTLVAFLSLASGLGRELYAS